MPVRLFRHRLDAIADQFAAYVDIGDHVTLFLKRLEIVRRLPDGYRAVGMKTVTHRRIAAGQAHDGTVDDFLAVQ